MKRGLLPLERKFLDEARAGNFLAALGDDGRPYAMGADHAGNLFSMDVVETPDTYPHESIYRLRDEYYEADGWLKSSQPDPKAQP